MRKLSDPWEFAQLELRLASLRSDSPRQWGSMSPAGMICHLCDSFRFALGEQSVSDTSNFFSRTVVKWIALHTQLLWPRGVRTMPEVDQKIGGTPPSSLDKDRAELLELMWRFVEERTVRPLHPIFGKLTENEWQHWGWRHLDHHLRQFGL